MSCALTAFKLTTQAWNGRAATKFEGVQQVVKALRQAVQWKVVSEHLSLFRLTATPCNSLSIEPCRSFDVRKDAASKQLRLRLAERQCLHHYFYFHPPLQVSVVHSKEDVTNSEKAMHIGLLRHFPVTEQLPTGWKTAAELQGWLDRYDLAETPVGEFDLGGIDWQACLASDMPRTRITAGAIYCGDVEHTDLLREAQFAPFRVGKLRLPVSVWKWILRLSWMTGHRSQRACRDDFRRRVAAVANRLCAMEQDTLVVSHAGMMAHLSAELRRRGFAGPKLRIAKHATAYVYQKTAARQ